MVGEPVVDVAAAKVSAYLIITMPEPPEPPCDDGEPPPAEPPLPPFPVLAVPDTPFILVEYVPPAAPLA
jgi:hypothetical protein